MVNFDLRLFNYPAERLIRPRQRLQPLAIPNYIKDLIPFQELQLDKVTADSDIISFIDYLSGDLGFNNENDLKEYISNHDFFILTKDLKEHQITKIVTTSLAYLFASKRVLQGLVTDDTIFSYHLPYIAEASYDLECSVALIQLGYFKQSLQTLRNVIEVTLTHGFYALQDIDYEDLLSLDEHKVPILKDIIRFLRTENLLSADVERQIFTLYKSLSGAVHSEIRKLNTTTNITDIVTLKEWYDFFAKTSVIHLVIIIRMIEVGI